MQTLWSIQFESDWAGSKLRNSGMMRNYLLRNRIKYSRKIDRVHFHRTSELYLNGHILDAPRSIFHRKVPTRRLSFSSLWDNLSGKETKKRKWVTLKCKHWEGTELPLKTEIDAKESTFHLSGWKFFPRPSPCSILICEQKKQWIRHRIDKLVLNSGIRKYCLLRRCSQPTSVIKWGRAKGFHMKDKSILNLLKCSGPFPRHHPAIFTWRSSPPHHAQRNFGSLHWI